MNNVVSNYANCNLISAKKEKVSFNFHLSSKYLINQIISNYDSCGPKLNLIIYFLLENTSKFDPKEQQIYKQKNNKETRRFNKF